MFLILGAFSFVWPIGWAIVAMAIPVFCGRSSTATISSGSLLFPFLPQLIYIKLFSDLIVIIPGKIPAIHKSPAGVVRRYAISSHSIAIFVSSIFFKYG
jgi:hypothetical protein